MNESKRLANQLKKALEGGAWHGPSWRDALEDVSCEQALEQPVGNAHSIAEIVLHASTWHEGVRQRLQGETPEVPDSQDWPVVTLTDESTWEAAKERLFTSGRALYEVVDRFPMERLHEPRRNAEGTWYELVIGELQHITYHAGQVSLLRKAGVQATSH